MTRPPFFTNCFLLITFDQSLLLPNYKPLCDCKNQSFIHYFKILLDRQTGSFQLKLHTNDLVFCQNSTQCERLHTKLNLFQKFEIYFAHVITIILTRFCFFKISIRMTCIVMYFIISFISYAHSCTIILLPKIEIYLNFKKQFFLFIYL